MTQLPMAPDRKEPSLIHHRIAARICLLALAACLLASSSGCTVVGFFFMAADEYRRSGTHIEPAEYTGLTDNNYAVLVTADRMIQAAYPEVVPQMTTAISSRLAEQADAAGYVPGETMLLYQYNHPSWSSMSYGEVADELGVSRLIVVDIQEFRLNDPGNRHIWDGVAAATIAVIEADGPYPDDVMHEHFVHVTFPDAGGYGPEDLSRIEMISVLKSRFINRATWPFYDAEMPNDPDY